MSKSLSKRISSYIGGTCPPRLSVSIAFSMLLSAAPLALAAADTADSDKQLKKADALMSQGKAGQAADILREVIRTNPDSAQAHMQLGAALAFIHNDKNEYDTAMLEEQQALKLDPKSFGARIILGHIYANLGKNADAIKLLKEACDLKPTSGRAQRDLGIAYLTDGKIDEAIEAFKKSVELNPKVEEAHLKLAILLSKKGNARDAIAEANEAVQLNGNDAEAHLALGNIMLESGDQAGSIDSFKSALRCNGKEKNALIEANALSGLGWAIAGKDASPSELDEGVMDQKKAVAISNNMSLPFLPAYVRLGELLEKQGKNKEAEDAFKLALSRSPDDAAVGTTYGKFLGRIGRKDEARAALKKVLEKSPHFKPASDELATLEQGKTK